jgi:hypothetical protein
VAVITSVDDNGVRRGHTEHRERAGEILTITSVCRGTRLSCEFRAANRGCIGNSDISEEAVAATTDSFNEAGTLGGVAEGLTDFADRLVEPVVEIHERVRGPEFLLKFLAKDDPAGVLKQHRQDLEGLLLKPNSEAALAQFASTTIQLEHPKTKPPASLMVSFHEEVNLW